MRRRCAPLPGSLLATPDAADLEVPAVCVNFFCFFAQVLSLRLHAQEERLDERVDGGYRAEKKEEEEERKDERMRDEEEDEEEEEERRDDDRR